MDKRERALVAWYGKQPDEIQLEIHQRQIEIRRTYHNDCRMRQEKPEISPDIERRQFLQAIKAVVRIQSDKRLSVFDDLQHIDEQRIALAKAAKKRSSPKRDKLLQELKPVVERLRGEGISWQGVADYLAKNHKKRISRAYLQKVYQASPQ